MLPFSGDLGKFERGVVLIAHEKILLINIHLFNTFYCYYQERERDSYNTDDKNYSSTSLDVIE